MNPVGRYLAGITLLVAVAWAAGDFSQEIRALAAEPKSPRRLAIQLSLDSQEWLWGAAAGFLTETPDPVLVFGTVLPMNRGRVRVFHWNGTRYQQVWVHTSELGGFDGATIRDVNNNRRDDLVTLWRAGSGGYLDVRIFEWNGRVYQEIWDLSRFSGKGQLLQHAGLTIRRIDNVGNVELVIRAPNVKPGESALRALPHQVSIYRWSPRERTFVLFRRFVDSQRNFE